MLFHDLEIISSQHGMYSMIITTLMKVLVCTASMNEPAHLLMNIVNFQTRWDITKKAIQALIGTFGLADYINIVEFNNDARALNKKTLLRATDESIAFFRDEVEKIVPQGTTDFRLGFEKAFDILMKSITVFRETEERVTSDCEKVG